MSSIRLQHNRAHLDHLNLVPARRHLILLDTGSVPLHLRNKTWQILSSFPNLEKLEFKHTYKSHAQDLTLFPRRGIVFAKLSSLKITLLEVDNQEEYSIEPDVHPNAKAAFLDKGLFKHYTALLGGPESLEARKSIGMSRWYKSFNTEDPVCNPSASFPALDDFYIRCGGHNTDDLLHQLVTSRCKGLERAVTVAYEPVRGGREQAETVIAMVFPKCEHLHMRTLHHHMTSADIGECCGDCGRCQLSLLAGETDMSPINMLGNLKTYTLSLSHCGWQEKFLSYAPKSSMRRVDLSSDWMKRIADRPEEGDSRQRRPKLEDLEGWVKSQIKHHPTFQSLTVFHRDDYRGHVNCGGGKWFVVNVKNRGKNKSSKVKGKVFWTDRRGQWMAEPLVATVQGDEGYSQGHRVRDF